MKKHYVIPCLYFLLIAFVFIGIPSLLTDTDSTDEQETATIYPALFTMKTSKDNTLANKCNLSSLLLKILSTQVLLLSLK